MKKNTAQNSGRTAGRSGRPKVDLAAEIARAIFEKNRDAIEKAFVKALKRGNPEVFAVLADRARGNPGGGPRKDIAAEIARAIFDKNPELIERNSRRLRGRVQG